MKLTWLKVLATLARILIGWHFLYEGVVKLLSPGWSAQAYLEGSRWIFSAFFHRMASDPTLLQVVDFLNVWGLMLVGLALMAGWLTRVASWCGALLLLFYFVAYPPIPGYTFGMAAEGNYLWVNKNLVELAFLLLLGGAPTTWHFGVDRLLKQWREANVRFPVPPAEPGNEKSTPVNRREILRDLVGIPFLGAFAYALYRKQKWDSFEEKYLDGKVDAQTSATLKTFNFTQLSELKGVVPAGKIKDLELSRLIMGGNLIGGWAHSRDLIYVSKLVKAYHTDERVINTLMLAEKCGINALLTNPQLSRIINKYWHETGGKMKFISDCGVNMDFFEGIKSSIDGGAHALYCQGEITDRWVPAGRIDDIAKGIELIRQNGLPAGIGAHRIESIRACAEAGLKPDFWVKTIHHHNYWSAQNNPEWHDNMFCFKPQETIDFMNSLEEPWIAFKVLAAGAIKPEDGFQYAFDNGADFICVGMYDFQIVDDVNITLDTLQKVNRVRPWRG